MIKGIGNDIVEIERIRKAVENPRFIDRYFTNKEKALFEARHHNVEILAGNFAIKESVSKVFGTGIRGFGLVDIEVLRDEMGKPIVVLHGNAKQLAAELDISSIHVTISHVRDYVVGFAVGEGEMR